MKFSWCFIMNQKKKKAFVLETLLSLSLSLSLSLALLSGDTPLLETFRWKDFKKKKKQREKE
ncbi:MAG: hypothetical protein N7Q72_06620, partial [Spiroplasma sp. Tabriz.8]|nr:hypothetical protein [Spiroplasma sp. Tabriz.8]